MKISFFREHIENYENRRGLSRKTLTISLGYLWAMLLFSILMVKVLWVRLLLIFIGAAVTTHILWVAKPKKSKKEGANETGFR